MSLDLEKPLRHPDTASAPLMNKRARWLVVAGFLFPGSAQVLSGNRRLGRIGIAATCTVIVLAVIAILGLLFFRTATLSVLTNPIVLFVVQWLLVAYAVLWLILGLDTLRLTRLGSVSTGWRIPIVILSLFLTVFASGVAAWGSSAVASGRSALSIFSAAPSVDPVDGRYNILLLGADAGQDRDGLRPDSISLISVDAKTGQSMIVGLPRELTEMPFPDDSPMQAVYPDGYCAPDNNYVPTGDGQYCYTTGYLNGLITELEDSGSPSYDGMFSEAASHNSSPGIEAMKDAVSGATGLDVQFYVLIDMEGFSTLIDALGGVTVDVQNPINLGGYEDPNTGEWVEGEDSIPAGKQHLSGEYALLYARQRHGLANGDYDRMQHQRQIQEAILAQMNPANVLVHFQDIAKAGSDVVKTDIPQPMLGYFVDLATKAKGHQPVSVELVPPAIDPENPDYAAIQQLVAEGVAAASPPKEDSSGG